jgi:hypothetical protein
MTELPIERELRAALDVDPTPQFATRVRARVAAEPERLATPSAVRFWMPLAAAAAAIVLVAIVWPIRPRVAPASIDVLASRPLGVGVAELRAATRTIAQGHGAMAVTSIRPSADPEVLVSASESRALLKLIDGPRTWQIDPSPLSAPPPVADLTIEPIVITPLSIDGGQGVRQ